MSGHLPSSVQLGSVYIDVPLSRNGEHQSPTKSMGMVPRETDPSDGAAGATEVGI
jgi:hypothetical protein